MILNFNLKMTALLIIEIKDQYYRFNIYHEINLGQL